MSMDELRLLSSKVLKVSVVLLLILAMFSCKKHEANFITLSTEKLDFSGEGGEKSFAVSSNVSWVITVADSWVKTSISSGDGVSTITISVSENYSVRQRSTTITVSANKVVETILVSQEQLPDFISLSIDELSFPGEGGEASFIISSNTSWSIAATESWVTTKTSSGTGESTVVLAVGANSFVQKRSATVTISTGTTPVKTISISQDLAPYPDGSVISYQTYSLTKANRAVNVVFVGDGFISDDYREGGAFSVASDKAIEAFFSVEPYPTYREYFNIYKVVAYSQERGATVQRDFYNSSVKKQTRKTVFNSVLDGGTSTGIACDANPVFEYAMRTGISQSELKNTTIIVIINLDVYAGTTLMYQDGKSIALCPTGDTLAEIVYHEGAGHGFGRLLDEYIYHSTQTYPTSSKQQLVSYRDGNVWSFGANVSDTGNLDEVHWKHYFEKSDYRMVGLYEGADLYGKGVWRPEENSCMNNNVPYFNAPSREAVVRRVMSINGNGFDYNSFYANDKYDYVVSSHTRSVTTRPPLGPPVLR